MTRITLDIVEAYSLCPRKACLLLIDKPIGVPHEYVHITDELATANREAHSVSLAQAADVAPGGIADLKTGAKVVANAELAANGLHAHCDFLTRVNGSSRLGRFGYEPVKVTGTCRASRPDALGLAYLGLVLNKHCPSCAFREACLQQAESEDNLSLLDRMTPKLMRKYHQKGIFTVKQLSYLYKPRRSRKNAKRPVRHSLELQALAIRSG